MSERQRYCVECIAFDPIHQCCRTRIDEQNTYLAREPISLACKEFGTPALPQFLAALGGQS
jgi:hypothetical protein